MISGYKIKGNILYVYLDYNYEFGILDFKNKINNIEKNIKKHIKNKKILFKGTTVAIVVGGIVIGNIMLNNDDKKEDIENNISYKYVVEDTNLEDTINVDIPIQYEEEIVEEDFNNDIEIKVESKEEKVNTKTQIEEEKVISNSETKETRNDLPRAEEKNAIVEQIIKAEVDNNTYVNVYRSNGSVIKLELEEYLIGCVGAEMPAAFNIEALKSQAIIARTYALKSIKTGKRLTDTESTQSYKSDDELRNTWGSSFDTYYNKIKNAVESTKGMYLSHNGDYIEAVYHSTSNGITESSSNIWGNYYPYLVNVSSEYDSDSPTYIQDKFISYEELSSKLNMEITIDTEFNILSRTSGDRVEYINIGEITLRGIDFRNKLGLRSNDFDISKSDTGITFTTRGYGHGVGMSQYGANGMAKRGYSYIDILSHYYPGTTLKIYILKKI